LNNELKHGADSVDNLEQQLHDSQYALDKVTGDRLKLENEFKIQVDNDAIAINKLKIDEIDLKHVLADRNEEAARLRSNLANLTNTVEMKRNDHNHLVDELKAANDDNARLK
jgi:septal ring factor EnvC (AmiA/AmiB activator)